MKPGGVNDAFTTTFKLGAYSSSWAESGCINTASIPLAPMLPVMNPLWMSSSAMMSNWLNSKVGEEKEEEEEEEDEEKEKEGALKSGPSATYR